MPKKISCWLIIGWLIASFGDYFLPHPTAYFCDPITGSILLTLAVSAASYGVEYLLAKNRKPTPVDRGKQDDIRISVPGYGEVLIKAWGTVRVAPIWFWHTPIVHTTVTTPGQGGGKGTPKPPTADTVDHIYTTSLAGAFHDGLIYKGVSRIWFDTDLVYHANFADDFLSLASTRYEAELGTLAGGASVTTQAECSGGKKVTGIGSGGSVTFSVTVASSGSYEMAAHYTSTADRTFKVSVNGGASTDVICLASGAASTVAIETLTISLNSGANTIAFANAGAACPDLDYIDVVPSLSFTDGVDTRSFSGLVDPTKIAPTDQDHGWAFNNEIPVFSDSDGGMTGGGFFSATLAKYGQPQIRIYPGSETQEQDPAIVADKGSANTPAYRGVAYIVIEGLQLQNGRIPNVTIEFNQGVRELPTIVKDIYGLVGVTSSDLSLTALNGLVLGDSSGYSAGTYAAITWTGLSNSTQTSDGAITKTSGTNNTWTAYANSGDSLSAGTDFSIRFTAGVGTFLVGYATTTTPGSSLPHPYDQVPFAVLLNLNSNPSQETKNSIQISLGGSNNSTDVGTWAVGDVFQVEIRNGRFSAYQNGILLTGFTIPVPSYPLKPIFMGYATGGGPATATYASGANIGSVPTVPNTGGFILSSRRAAGELISELQTRFQFDLPEVDGVIKAVLRSGSSDLTIPYSELRAHYEGEEMPAYDALITDIDPLLLPKRVDVNYLDPQLDYHNNTQSAMRLVGPQYDEQSVSLSLADSADNMKKIATVLLYKPDREGRSFKITTGPKYMRAHPGTVMTLTLPNATHVARVVEAKYGLPAGVCEFDLVRQEASLYTPSGLGSTGSGTEPPIVAVPGNTKGVFIDAPLVEPENAGDLAQPLLYLAMAGRGSGQWNGGFLYKEHPIDSGVYQLITSDSKAAGIGLTSTALVDVSDITVLDSVSSLVVGFYSNTELSSELSADVLANPKLNLLAVITPDDEVEFVQFTTATPTVAEAPYITKYILTGFYRGLSNTDGNMGLHTTADQVVVMNSAVKAVPMNTDDINVERRYKFVTSGQSVEDAAIVPFTWLANSMRAGKVTDVLVAKDASSYWLIQFVGHPRLSEQPATYTVQVKDIDGLVVRVIPVTEGTTHAVLLDTSGSVVFDELAGDNIYLDSTHSNKNNFLADSIVTATGQTLEALSHTYTRFDFTFATDDNTSPGATDMIVASLEEGDTFDTLNRLYDYSVSPVSITWEADGSGNLAEKIRSFSTVVSTRTTSGWPADESRRYSILLSGTEYRIYQDYSPSAGQIPIAIIPVAGAGFTFPLRLHLWLVDSGTSSNHVTNIISGGALLPTTIYSEAQQNEDFATLPPTLYLTIYQNGLSPVPDGFPVDVSVQTRGGHVLLQTGDDLLLESGDFMLKE